MQSLDSLSLVPVWVNPEHLAATAKILLSGHRLKVIAVVDGSELVGVVTAIDLEDQPDDAKVKDFMRRPERVADSATPLREVAETFWQEDLDYLPVLRDERFQGIVTPNMLLREMARSWDPLTGLPWSDRLREWGVDNLKNGHEITILFVDLDDFGSYNKRYGHIVGDRVLQKVADMIQERIDPATELLVRYGGDEFAIGTVLDQDAATALSRRLAEGMAAVKVAGSDEAVTFSVGVQGGKRTRERENVHYAATLDNLINLASKLAMAEKGAKKMSPPQRAAVIVEDAPAEEVSPETAADLAEAHGEATPVPTPPMEPGSAEPPASETAPELSHAIPAMRVMDVVADAADANSVTQVSIEVSGRTVTGVCPRKGGSVVKSVALATANAIAQVRPDVKLDIRDVNLTESETGVRFISVIGTSVVDGEDQPIGGVGTVGRNLYLTIAEATLQAYSNYLALR